MKGDPKIDYIWCHWINNIDDAEWQYCDSGGKTHEEITLCWNKQYRVHNIVIVMGRLIKKYVFMVFSKVFIKTKFLKFVDGLIETKFPFLLGHIVLLWILLNLKSD